MCAFKRMYTHLGEREISSYSGKDSIGSCRVEIIAVFFSTYLISEVYYAECLLITTIKETRTEQNQRTRDKVFTPPVSYRDYS